MNNSKNRHDGCSKPDKETLCTFSKDQSWIYCRDPERPGSGNKPEAHCTLICFNFHISSVTAPPLWSADAGRVAAFLLGDVMHVSLRGAKFDSTPSRQPSHPCTGCVGGGYDSGSEYQTRKKERKKNKTRHSDTHSRHGVTQRWQLFGVCL